MNDLLANLQTQIIEELVGMIGGMIFFASWLLQAWQSRRAGQPVVSQGFFLVRASASALLTVEGIRIQSLSISLVMGATLLLMLYNIYLIRRNERNS